MFARVVVNCGAGSVDAEEQDAQEAEILAAFEAAGARAEIASVQGVQLEQAIGEAAAAGPDAVVIAGGDGTIGTAAAVLAEYKVPMGVLPLGTFNHFAKDLGIPVDLAEAVAVIAAGRAVPVDACDVSGRWFVNNSSIGVYPVMVALRDEIRERRGWGKVRTVPVASWRVLRRFPARRVTISADGYRSTLRTPFVFVGNNSYDDGSGGVGTRLTLDGGELCVYVARAASRLRLFLLTFAAVVRDPANVTGLDVHCAPEITIEAGRHRLHVAVDGEVTTMQAPLRFRVHPGALSVLVPADASDDHADDASATA